MPMITGIVIPADDYKNLRTIEFDSDATEVISEITKDDCSVKHTTSPAMTAWMNCYGFMANESAFNLRASLLLWSSDDALFNQRQPYFGDIVFTGLPDEASRPTSIPESLLSLVFHNEAYRAEYRTDEPCGHWLTRPFPAYNYWTGLYDLFRYVNHLGNVNGVRLVPA